MKRLKARISNTNLAERTGRLFRIPTDDAGALKAIHEFLRFQIKEHMTGDPVGQCDKAVADETVVRLVIYLRIWTSRVHDFPLARRFDYSSATPGAYDRNQIAGGITVAGGLPSPEIKTEMPGMKMPSASPTPTASPQMKMPMPAASPSPSPMTQMPGMQVGSMNMGPLVVSGDDMGIRVGSSEQNSMSMAAMGSGTSCNLRRRRCTCDIGPGTIGC